LILSFDEFIFEDQSPETSADGGQSISPIVGDKDAPWFIILLGGSGTGKGALVNTDKALGEIGQYIQGKTFSTSALRHKVNGGEDHIRSVFEPDRILRLVQYDAGVSDYKKIISADKDKKLKEVLDGVFGDKLSELKAYLIKVCGGENSTVEDFIGKYAENDQPADSPKYKNGYIGKKYQPRDVEDKIEAVDILDALEDNSRSEADHSVAYFYQQMRKRVTDVSKGEPLKTYAVKKANELMQAHLDSFKKVFSDATVHHGSVILDSAGEDLAEQPVKTQLESAKAAGFNTLILLLCTAPVQSFIGNAERKIARAARGVPSEEIMSFYKILPVKHKEFRSCGVVDKILGYKLLDGYCILNQEQITAQRLLDVIYSLCVGSKEHGPASKNKTICTDPDGRCVDRDLYPDYLSGELQSAVKKVNNITKKRKSVTEPARDWTEVFNDEDRRRELGLVHDKIKRARIKPNNTQDLPLELIDGFSTDAAEMFADWKDVVTINKKEMKSESKILSFARYVLLQEGFGEEPFVLTKNGDDYNYFFKVNKRGFVLSINKSATIAKPADDAGEYAVLHLTEISEDELEQAVLDKGRYNKNTEIISADDNNLVGILSNVAECVSDYLDQNSGIVKFYDEIPVTLRSQRYLDKMRVSFDKWPGEWNIQEQEPGKLNIISK